MISTDQAVDEGKAGATDWSIFLPLLTKRRGQWIVLLLRRLGIDRKAELQDPRISFVSSYDRVTAQWLLAALSDHNSVVPNFGSLELVTVSPVQARARCEGVKEDLGWFIANGIKYHSEVDEGLFGSDSGPD